MQHRLGLDGRRLEAARDTRQSQHRQHVLGQRRRQRGRRDRDVRDLSRARRLSVPALDRRQADVAQLCAEDFLDLLRRALGADRQPIGEDVDLEPVHAHELSDGADHPGGLPVAGGELVHGQEVAAVEGAGDDPRLERGLVSHLQDDRDPELRRRRRGAHRPGARKCLGVERACDDLPRWPTRGPGGRRHAACGDQHRSDHSGADRSPRHRTTTRSHRFPRRLKTAPNGQTLSRFAQLVPAGLARFAQLVPAGRRWAQEAPARAYCATSLP